MDYSFDIDHAKKYGTDEAIVIKTLVFWIHKNRTDARNFHDGRTWTYNTVLGWQEHFPFWSREQMRRVLDRLKTKGVILTGNYNNTPMDRTIWYSFSDESIFLPRQIQLPESANGNAGIDTAIPDTTQLPSSSKKAVASLPRFQKPTLDQVKAYCQERNNSVNPEKWLAHYEANGWRVGKNPMKDWKAAVRTWEHSDFGAAPKTQQTDDSWRFKDPRAERLKEAANAR